MDAHTHSNSREKEGELKNREGKRQRSIKGGRLCGFVFVVVKTPDYDQILRPFFEIAIFLFHVEKRGGGESAPCVFPRWPNGRFGLPVTVNLNSNSDNIASFIFS